MVRLPLCREFLRTTWPLPTALLRQTFPFVYSRDREQGDSDLILRRQTLRAAASRPPGYLSARKAPQARSIAAIARAAPLHGPGWPSESPSPVPGLRLLTPAPEVSPAGLTVPPGQPLGRAGPALAALHQSELRLGSRSERGRAGFPHPLQTSVRAWDLQKAGRALRKTTGHGVPAPPLLQQSWGSAALFV